MMISPRKMGFPIFYLIFCFFFPSLTFAQQPNFVIIIGDDISWNDYGCYGNTAIRTPEVDQLASGGIAFTNTFLTASSCSPSRCSIMSGRYPHNTGAAELHTPLPEGMPTIAGELKKGGYYTAAAGKWHMGENIKPDFDRIEGPGNSGGEGTWLPVLQERPKDKPFFMWLASLDAHRIWHADDWGEPHKPENVIVPGYLADTPETRQDLASYYNEVSRMDFYVGEVKKELEKQGVLDNTIIIVMADNGMPFPRSKTRVYDSGMKTPFVVFWPKGISPKGVKSNSLISVIDIAPTFVELAGLKSPDSFQGKSFAEVLKKPDKEFRRFVFSEHNWHDYESHERMVRSKDFLYVLNSRPQFPNGGPADSKSSPAQHALNDLRDKGLLSPAQADVFITPRPFEELFDVNRDPNQFNNIASLEEYQEVLKDYRFILNEWRVLTKDNTPGELTKDGFDRETGRLLENVPKFNEVPRGEMPGVKSGGLESNAKPGF
ncbi:sulfatase family protein [Flexithrix dorotheae]|uniref:sulfatase family protein n=1 Tax=Flexithrix dorotheae TaxID=70993 RepID=UPI001FE0DA43|nr:sulfatase [Flexithrix dorotheae]